MEMHPAVWQAGAVRVTARPCARMTFANAARNRSSVNFAWSMQSNRRGRSRSFGAALVPAPGATLQRPSSWMRGTNHVIRIPSS